MSTLATRPLSEAQCAHKHRCHDGKAYFQSAEVAEAAARALREGRYRNTYRIRPKHHKRRQTIQAYPCPYCEYWHIGHRKPNGTQDAPA